VNMLEKIKLMMEERGLSAADVSKGTGLPYTTFDGLFKKGFENARYPTVRKLATFFDVSMEYLINEEITDRNFGKTSPVLTHEEENMIHHWRKLPRDEQMRLFGWMQAIAEREDSDGQAEKS
jgi:transcriptional regulator with XRE-family HTH domain